MLLSSSALALKVQLGCGFSEHLGKHAFKKQGVEQAVLGQHCQEVCSFILSSVSCLFGYILDAEETWSFQLAIYVLFLLYI